MIVELSSYPIVDVLPRTGRSTAAAPAPQSSTSASRSQKTNPFFDRGHSYARSSRTEQPRTEQRTTTASSTASTRVRIGDRLPDSVEIRFFPDDVYREPPGLREYRYLERDNRTYVVAPHERTIIDEVDW
ncbi:DUF1236 domain-containing protein [Bradyrhizobium sp. URHD0069]|uniref:DUF1236 domain-containing protein n=1 Tax=Bradyrhizobium sp. URHD0069 TaxID=1380355 RepID=UPI00068E20F5|nr:DUF1236 domain-containing protein [Bradyrhizobium sp. URHD0069]